MLALIIQALLLIAIAYILGCIIGCLFHQWFAPETEIIAAKSSSVASATATPAPRATPTAPPPPKPASAAATARPKTAPRRAAKPKTTKAKAAAKPKTTKAKAVAKPKAATKPASSGKSKSPTKAKTAAKSAATRSRAAAKPKAVTKSGAPDNLKHIKGIGPQNEARLKAVGITKFTQIAAWSKKQQADMGDRLEFPGRIEREDWVKQAAVLAKGGNTKFSKRVAKGQVASSMAKGKARKTAKKTSS